jgi:hypothetical protein
MTSLEKFVMAEINAIAHGSRARSVLPGFADTVTPPPVPKEIQVPPGNTAFLMGSAVGTQNYICLPSGWAFFGPQATLFLTFTLFGNDIKQQIITHFLSPNPVENGTPRATWQNSFDSSTVWAIQKGSSDGGPGAIQLLLLQVVGALPGPTGGDLLTQTTYIQRLNTSGGVKPSSGCADSTTVGSKMLVPYTADYFFYKADGD